MSEKAEVAVIVPDREMRDLICLNLRFESIETDPFESVEDFTRSNSDTSLVIIEFTGDGNHQDQIKQLENSLKHSFPIIALLEKDTPDIEIVRIEIDAVNGHKRFDASELVDEVNNLLESQLNEPLKHPLTGLPSGSVVERHIVGLLASGKDFSLIATDMDNMKAFNQKFGYAVGDKLLVKLVDLITRIMGNDSDSLNFLGHRGEDDFVAVSDPDQALSIAEKVVDGFDAMISEFFSQEDMLNGFFLVKDRRGNELKFPLTTVSIVIVNTKGRSFYHPAELYDVVEELMLQVKVRGINQSYCVIDKREKWNNSRDVFI